MKSQLVSHSNEAWLHRLFAPFLRSGASQAEKDTGTGIPRSSKVLPHPYGTHEKDAPKRAAEGMLPEGNTGGGAAPPEPEPRRLGRPGMDSQQLGHAPCVALLCWAAANVLGFF